MKASTLQFEIWHDCDVGCRYCYLSHTHQSTTDDKNRCLKVIQNTLTDVTTYDKYKIVSLIGGEMYQGQLSDSSVKENYMKVGELANFYLEKGLLQEFWTTASLTRNDQSDLLQFIDLFKDKSKIRVCTSYDLVGRFHTAQTENNWHTNMEMLSSRYPEIRKNTTTILTGIFMEKYIADPMYLKNFMKDNDTSIYLKVAEARRDLISNQIYKSHFNDNVIQNFFPTRQCTLKFLNLYHRNATAFEYNLLHSNENRADTMVQMFNQQNVFDDTLPFHQRLQNADNNKVKSYFANETGEMVEHMFSNKCGHDVGYQTYVDSDKCFICDKNMFL